MVIEQTADTATILLVDDDPNNLKVIYNELSTTDYDLLLAQSGFEALEIVEEYHPDLILLDILMPEMDGFEVCKRIKENPGTSEIPVLFLSALSETIDKVKGFKIGGSDYITKPVNFEELRARIKAHLTIKKQQEEIHEKEIFFQTIADFTYDLEYWIDQDMKLKYISPSCKRITGYTSEEFYNNNDLVHEMIHPAERAVVTEKIKSYFESDEVLSLNYRIVHKDGHDVWIARKCQPVFINGEFQGRRVSCRDITDLIDIQKTLEESERELKETNRAKDKFFSIIAHDLKNPFTGLLGFSEYLAKFSDEIPVKLKKTAGHMYDSARAVFNLLQNLLHWSRLQTGTLQINPVSFNIRELSEEIIDLYSQIAGQKKLEVINEIETELFVYADKFMMETVLRNLISNAVKFTNKYGQINLSSDKTDETVIINVADTGVGMEEEELEELFRIDVQHSTKGTENEVGTGLGLVLCKEFVEKNNGSIFVSSERGEGSTFTFSLPAGRK